MRSIHFRVSDAMYTRVQEEAEALEVSVARFCREAAVARTALWAHRRGFEWADADAWEDVMDAIHVIDEHDVKHRAQLARQARLAKSH